MLAAGVDLGIVSKMLGHSSIALTADTYSHLLEGVGQQAAEAADALVPRRRDRSVTTGAIGDFLPRSDADVSPGHEGAPSGTRTPNPLKIARH
jgi:hypothetical protein